MHRIDLTPVYVLHTRPFRDTSLIVELFSEIHGRISVVARSARGSTSRYKGQLQLFTPLLASWSGHHELKMLGNIELNGMPLQLNDKPLFCGFYFNELLTRLLHKEDPHPRLFACYHQSLCRLEKGDLMSVVLRLFEKKLLDDLGYGLPLQHEAKTQTPIQSNLFYYFEKEHGFFQCAENSSEHQLIFSGADLMAIAEEKFENDSTSQTAKKLMRFALSQLLGNRPLNSREFF